MNDNSSNNTLESVLTVTVNKLLDVKQNVSTAAEKIEVDGKTIIPISKISVGFAGGGADVSNKTKDKTQNPAGTGAGITETPLAFLVVDGADVKLINLTTENKPKIDAKIIDTVISLFNKKKQSEK